MTRKEINRKINEMHAFACDRIGGCLKIISGPETRCRCDWSRFEKDWHADANWPTLLREMPDPVLTWLGKPFGWECWYKQYDPNWSNYSPDCGEAVCLAWLKWKTSGGRLMRGQFTQGKQPCSAFKPKRDGNEHAEWDNEHVCLYCEGTATVSWCENCWKDHHSGGYETCKRFYPEAVR